MLRLLVDTGIDVLKVVGTVGGLALAAIFTVGSFMPPRGWR